MWSRQVVRMEYQIDLAGLVSGIFETAASPKLVQVPEHNGRPGETDLLPLPDLSKDCTSCAAALMYSHG